MEEAREDRALTAGDEAPPPTADGTNSLKTPSPSSPRPPDGSLDGPSRARDGVDFDGSPRPSDAQLRLAPRLLAEPAICERRSTQGGLEGDTAFAGEWDLDGGDTDLGGLPLPLTLVLVSTTRPAGEVVDVATLPLDRRRLFSSLTTSSSSSSSPCVCAREFNWPVCEGLGLYRSDHRLQS